MKTIIAAIIAVGAAGGVQAQSPESVMDRAAKTYSAVESARVEFRQTITNPITGTNAVSRGVLFRKDPNLLSITFTDPSGDRVVADGRSVWIYLPSSAPGQVVKMSADNSASMAMVDPAGAFLTSPSTRYTITSAGSATISGHKTTIMNLVPKKSNEVFTKARVWVDASDYSIRQFEVVDVNGLTRLVTITSIKVNPSIPKSAFEFSPPKGTRIIDTSAMSGT